MVNPKLEQVKSIMIGKDPHASRFHKKSGSWEAFSRVKHTSSKGRDWFATMCVSWRVLALRVRTCRTKECSSSGHFP